MTLWTKEKISKLTKKEIKQWFDVYNYGLLKDRGHNIKELNDIEIKNISKSIEADYTNYLLNLVNDSNFVFYSIFYLEDIIVSICRVILINDKYYIEGLETHRDYRRNGYGKKVLEFTISELSKRGINKLYSSIRKYNTASIRTHEIIGFKIINETKDNDIFVIDVARYSKIKLFNEWAPGYNDSVKKSDESNTYPFSGYSVIKREIFDLVIESEDTRVLEMGIGTGEITYPIYKLGYDITGVDLSYKMIQKSKELMPNATLIQADFISAINELKDEKYDVIIFNYSIHHLEYINQINLLESLHKNLNPKGIIVIGDVMTKTNKEMKELSNQYESSWDDEEYYPTYEEYNNRVLNKVYTIEHKQISHCSGIIKFSKKNFVIRKGDINDAKGRGYVHYQSWNETYKGLINQEYLDSRSLDKCVKKAMEYPENTYVALVDGKIVGFSCYIESRDKDLKDTGEIMAIYILKDYYGYGIGKKLMNECYKELSKYNKISLWVLKTNLHAIKFYEYLGFKLDGKEKEIVINEKTILNEVRMILHDNPVKNEYISNPCRYSALPLYKDIRVDKKNVTTLHNDDYKESISNQYSSHERFFRISHNLNEIDEIIVPGFNFRICDISKDIDIVRQIINQSYDDIKIYNEQILSMIKDRVYYPDLWVFIVDEKTNQEVALGICNYDEYVGEVELDWIQVLPQYRGRGLAKMLVLNLLKKLPSGTKFATVSGDMDNSSSPEYLYRNCGFKGKDVWHILRK